MTRARFERLVAEATTLIPERFQRAMENLVIIVEDEPSAELLDEMGVDPDDPDDGFYGLFEGDSLLDRTENYILREPSRITLFQRTIEQDCETDDDVRVVIGETLIHEVGHYFGLTEEEIDEVERLWAEGDGDPQEDDEDDR